MSKFSINLWYKKGGTFAVSHKEGLSAEQVAELQSLKPGDQFIVYVNTKKGDTSPDLTLRRFIPKESIDGGL